MSNEYECIGGKILGIEKAGKSSSRNSPSPAQRALQYTQALGIGLRLEGLKLSRNSAILKKLTLPWSRKILECNYCIPSYA